MNNLHLWQQLRALYAARNEPESIRPLADLYWRLLLSCALVLILAALAWGTYVFVGVLSVYGSLSEGKGVTRSVALDRSDLEATLEKYAQRQQLPDSSWTPIADPSR